MTDSPQQLAFYSELANRDSNILLSAVAGSGKTTTIVNSPLRVPSMRSSLFIAFNKHIATELESRLPFGTKTSTFHSLGLAAWKSHTFKSPKVDGNKVGWILKDILPTPSDKAIYLQSTKQLVGFAKNAGLGTDLLPKDILHWQNLIDHNRLYCEGDDLQLIEYAQQALSKSNEDGKKCVDFDDMLYLPLLHKVQFPKFSNVFIDEAQDTNAVQQALLSQMRADRVIAVGDPAQAIYGFRGADSDAMRTLGGHFNSTVLDLSVSWRCASSIVDLAAHFQQTLTGQKITASPSAPLGAVGYPPTYGPKSFSPSDVILCRNTLPLIQLAFKLITAGIGVNVLGRDIGQSLLKLIDACKVTDIDELPRILEVMREKEVSKLHKRGDDSGAQAAHDKYLCLLLFVHRCHSVAQLRTEIEKLFGEKIDGLLTLSTIHKAKGLEWERVFILDWNLLPSKFAKLPWQQQQERNLQYVAVTRAKLELNFINSDDFIP